jgi:hypothetical protein
MFKQNIRKKKHSKTRIEAFIAAKVTAAKTLKKNDALGLKQ